MEPLKVTFKVNVTKMAKVKLFFAVIAKRIGLDGIRESLVNSARSNIHPTKV